MERPVFEQHVFEEYLHEHGNDRRHQHYEALMHAFKAGMANALERAKDTCTEYGDDCKERSDKCLREGERGTAYGLVGEMAGAKECAVRMGGLKDRLASEGLLTRGGQSGSLVGSDRLSPGIVAAGGNPRPVTKAEEG